LYAIQFVMPKFMSNAARNVEVNNETVNTKLGERIKTLEQMMEDKNKAVVAMIQTLSTKMDAIYLTPLSYARVTNPAPLGIISSLNVPGMNKGHPPQLVLNGIPNKSVKDGRTPQVKRKEEVAFGFSEVINKRKKNFSKQNVIVGTGSTESKLRSLPADIFVYGLLKDTSNQELVEELSRNDIMVNSEDVAQMSKEEAHFKSFKVSMKADDLQKALDPKVWPTWVRVRQFFHKRSNFRNKNQESGSAKSPKSSINVMNVPA